MKIYFLFLLLPLLLLTVSTAHAAGIQVSPAKLNLQASPSIQTWAELVVTNPTSDVQLYEVYPDDFAESLKASPASFTLEAKTEKTVRIMFQPIKTLDGILKTNLSVIAKPLAEAAFQANSGVKIPLTITILPAPSPSATTTNPVYLYILYACLAAAFVSFAAVYGLHKRKKNINPTSLSFPSLDGRD